MLSESVECGWLRDREPLSESDVWLAERAAQ